MSRPLRVVVASDAIGPLDSEQAGVAIARGWADHAQVAVVPLAESGPALAHALAALLGGEPVITDEGWWLRTGDTLALGLSAPVSEPGWDPTASSGGFGDWLAGRLGGEPVPDRLILDLSGVTALDGGAGLLAGLGVAASDPAAGLAAVRRRFGAAEVIGVISPDEIDRRLLGLQGEVSRRGFAVRLDPAELLAAESAMGRWLAALGVDDQPGTGAAGGAVAAVRALGGRVLRGTELCAELAGLARTLAQADAVITGCAEFHIGNRGGQVVRFVADLAVAAQRPCLVFAGESSLSRREMRTFGVESAHPLEPGPLPEVLTGAAVRVARGWTAAARRSVD